MNNKQTNINKPRVNHAIKGVYQTRLIYKENENEPSENEFNKIVSFKEAIQLSKEYGLDLIEINPKADPVVIKLADYSKYMYNLKKHAKQQNKNKVVLKELQLSVNISKHDLQIKVDKALKFLEKGCKVKVMLTIKGRELSRLEQSKKSFYEFIDMMIESGSASFDGDIQTIDDRRCFVIFKKK